MASLAPGHGSTRGRTWSPSPLVPEPGLCSRGYELHKCVFISQVNTHMTSCPYPSAWQGLESELGGPGAAGSWPCPPTWVCLWPGPSASQCGAWPVAGVSGGRRPLARAAAAMSRKEEGQKLGAPNWAHGEDGAWLTLSRCSCPGPRWVGPRLLRKLRHLSGKETSSPLRRRSFSDQSRPSLNLRALHASPVPHPTPTHFGFNLGSESLGMLVVPPGPFPRPLPPWLSAQ